MNTAFETELAALNLRMWRQLPGGVEQLQKLVEAACTGPEAERVQALPTIEMNAHRLRGRAALLQLALLADAAARLEECAQCQGDARDLRAAMAACVAVLAGLPDQTPPC